MVMNLGLQKYLLKKVIEKNYRARHLPQEILDELLESAWEDEIDDELELPENISCFYEKGILVNIPSEEEERWHYNDVRNDYINSITMHYYHCQFDGCDFQTPIKEDMVKHFQEKHGLDDSRIPPKNPHDMTYIILDELLLIAMSKEYRKKKNFTVSNQHLWLKLIKKLGYDENDDSAPSNQKPRQILEKLGLLGKHKYQKRNKIGFDKNSRRVYHLNKEQLEDAILESEFNDLKAKLD
jgi:hypothetical protein